MIGAGRRPQLRPRGDLDPQRAEEAAARIELLVQFESLGENCELGFVQEHLGARPIGLFRWSGIDLDPLVTALNSDLAGIGEPEHTELYNDDVVGEYYVRDLRYGMPTHTGMFTKDHSAEDVRKLLCVRSRRLREKLIEDLEEAAKIFVFQSKAAVSWTELLRLQAAVGRLGPSAELLFVSPTQDRRRVGAVKRAAPGLLLGYLDRAGFDGSSWRISYQLWLSILAKTARRCGRNVSRQATADIRSLDLPWTF